MVAFSAIHIKCGERSFLCVQLVTKGKGIVQYMYPLQSIVDYFAIVHSLLLVWCVCFLSLDSLALNDD